MLPILVKLEKSVGGEFVLALVAQPVFLFRLVNGDDVFFEVFLFSEGPFTQRALKHRPVTVPIAP